MKKLRVFGIIGGAALLAAAPFSLQWSQNTVTLSLDSADARIGRPLTPLSVAGVQRRSYRRAVRSTVYAGAAGAVGYGVGAYYGGYGYPAIFRTLRALLRNWLRLWVVLRRQQLSILQLCWLRLSLLWLCWLQLSFLWLRLPPWLSRRPQGGHSSSPLALKSLAPRGAARWLVAHYIRSDPGNPSSSSSHR